MVKIMSNTLVFGFGINDANYTVSEKINGRRVLCNFYRTWRAMLQRCYSDDFHKNNKSYKDCFVCDEWLIFSNFKDWMQQQDWQGKELDKDLLVRGNKVYCPELCVFVDKMTNSFFTNTSEAKGKYPIGVSISVKTGKFHAMCCNPFTGKRVCLGTYLTPEDAHKAWLNKKNELAQLIALKQTDYRVAEAIVRRLNAKV